MNLKANYVKSWARAGSCCPRPAGNRPPPRPLLRIGTILARVALATPATNALPSAPAPRVARPAARCGLLTPAMPPREPLNGVHRWLDHVRVVMLLLGLVRSEVVVGSCKHYGAVDFRRACRFWSASSTYRYSIFRMRSLAAVNAAAKARSSIKPAQLPAPARYVA